MGETVDEPRVTRRPRSRPRAVTLGIASAVIVFVLARESAWNLVSRRYEVCTTCGMERVSTRYLHVAFGTRLVATQLSRWLLPLAPVPHSHAWTFQNELFSGWRGQGIGCKGDAGAAVRQLEQAHEALGDDPSLTRIARQFVALDAVATDARDALARRAEQLAAGEGH